MKSFLIVSMVFTGFAFGSDHPGNVYIAGNDVRVSVPATWTGWRGVDIDGKEVGHGAVQNGVADLGKLPTGYFEVREQGGTVRITAGVVEKVNPVETTPIALDTAMTWFYSDPQVVRDVCAICRMAGVKWVRDRGSWPEIETARGVWSADSRYERTMHIEKEEGLKILQVNHISPAWATSDAKHMPDDLRDVYTFYRGLAKRWKRLADAIEPWNEPDIVEFGGHTGCEIASFQKAAYLGLKAGNPDLPVCESVFAIARAATLDEFGANEVYPYFDRYDLHHYTPLPSYPRVYAMHRAESGGRPMWTTEFNLMVKWADEKTKEPSDDQLRVQGYRVSKVFAEALNQGTEKAFYFILGDYVERNLQYGLLHQDLTPRPAYLAFAAVGRLLNGARPIGQVDFGDEKLKGYVFKTEVDGAAKETLVAWSETKKSPVEIRSAEKAYDYLGREMPGAGKVELSREPVFVVMPPGGSKEMKVEAAPAKAPWQAGDACPVVLQLIGKGDMAQSAFLLDETKELRLVAYNFGQKAAKGTMAIEGAKGAAAEIEIPAGGREEWKIKTDGSGKVTVHADLGEIGHAVVSARVTTTASP